MQEIITDKLTLESMKNMSIDQIVDLYKRGYIIDNSSQIEGLPDNPETSRRLIRYGFMDDTVSNYPIPPSVYERWDRQKKYGFTGQESERLQSLQGVSVSSDALLLIGIGALIYLYIKKDRKIMSSIV